MNNRFVDLSEALYAAKVSSINFHTKEISVKLVYYGPGLCGKTSSLHAIYGSLPEQKRPKLVSLATEVDRTIFFDFLPLTAYRIRDFTVRLQLYTVPGQVFYNATRKLVLQGVDGIVFVADSQKGMREANLESLQNLEDNLGDLGIEMPDLPWVIQANKRDLDDIYSIEEMDELYNKHEVPLFATVATKSEGIFEALKVISRLVINNLVRKGLGKQLTGPVSPDEAGIADETTNNDGLGASISSATEAAAAQTPLSATPAQSRAVHGPHWPTGVDPELCGAVDKALTSRKWGIGVLAVDALLNSVATTWAAQGGAALDAPLASYLVARGAHAARYPAYAAALEKAKAQQDVSQQEALNAYVLALDAVW